ncbi:cytochrome P450 [Aspergillus avenaceus]|uniref:Cytochrome P450 n=1 Tax=Aspergillus avenaceus TaxID=36643 RepID=A0A5N6U0Y3_ASPAV|nr:cytochrome P450 [Aspergillus avenaceus]
MEVVGDALVFLRTLKTKYGLGAVSVRVFGYTHNIILDPTLAKRAFEHPPASFDPTSITWTILHRVFGAPAASQHQYISVFRRMCALLTKYFLKRQYAAEIIARTATNMAEILPQLIQVPGHGDCANTATQLPPLVRRSFSRATLQALTGKTFLDAHPTLLDDLWTLDESFAELALGVPSWLPIPKLRRASAARTRLTHALEHFITLEQDAQDPTASDAIRSLNELWRSENIPIPARTAILTSIFWAMQPNSTNAAFWMLLRILSTDNLAERIRSETAPFIHPTPTSTSSININISTNTHDLPNSCPLLRACFHETLRLHHGPWSTRRTRSAITLHTDKETYLIPCNEYIHVPHGLEYTSETHFQDAKTFNPDRFLRPEARTESLHFFGAGSSMCKGYAYAEASILVFVACALHTWDIKPAHGQWKLPRAKSTGGVERAVEDVDVSVTVRRL